MRRISYQAVKKYLMRYGRAKADFERQIDLVEKLTELKRVKVMMLEFENIIPSTASDGMPHSHTASDKLALMAAEIDDIERTTELRIQSLIQLTKECQRIMCEVANKIESIPVRNQTDEHCKELLRYRYIDLMRWTEIENEMNYGSQYIRGKLHSRALSLVKL